MQRITFEALKTLGLLKAWVKRK